MNHRSFLREWIIQTQKQFQAALVCMPFFGASQPSIQISLLQSLAERAGFVVDSYHLNLHLAARLDQKVYDVLSTHRGRLTSEWIFSKALFKEKAVPAETYFSRFPDETKWLSSSENPVDFFKRIQDQIVPRFLNDCMRLTNWSKYDVVGFSSTFQQNIASLAFARRLKRRYPDMKILFGGANMEGEMGQEYLRVFLFIDYVATGEGDLLFPLLLKRLSTAGPIEDLPGLAYRSNGKVQTNPNPAPLENMDSLTTPNYEEYFRRFKKLKLDRRIHETYLPIETARGCWWGEKHHCTFCGLNGLNMKFRAKSARRVLKELSELSRNYGFVQFAATDNILDLKYLNELFTQVQASGGNYRFAWEIKANLSREQLRRLFLGGIRQLQPGIESLNTHILQLMRKGCSMLQNLVTLKWCRYYRIDVLWSLLYGFPGEEEEDYERELAVLKLISHLGPPIRCSQIWLERFAPYFFDRQTFPVFNVRPEASYYYVYPPEIAMEKIAYFFDYEMGQTASQKIQEEKRSLVLRWQESWKAGRMDSLSFRKLSGKLLIRDFRRLLNRSMVYEYGEAEALAYDFCNDTFHSIGHVREYLTSKTATRWDDQRVRGMLDAFCARGLMAGEDGKYLVLALPEAETVPSFP